MLSAQEKTVLAHLGQFVSEHKKEVLARVLDLRTRYITVVLEDIYQSQNASAAIRTCECMGIQDVHMVENISKYSINPKVLRGANKWTNIVRYQDRSINTTVACLESLRQSGYRILVTDPGVDGVSIHEVDTYAGPMAIWFGNELHGISADASRLADLKVYIPMHGFTESLNISASVAITLDVLVTQLHAIDDAVWKLSEDEKEELKLKWYRKMVRKSALIEREFLRTNN